jgi:CheY-like chemotaxis protein
MSESRETLKKKADTADAELRAVLTMTDDAVLLLDSRTTIRGANPAAEELFGKSIDDLVGEELQRLIAHPLNLPELTRSGPALFKSTTSQPGEKAKIDIVLSEVHFSKGTSFLALIRDENAAPKEVAETERVPDLSAPVGKFCHDLNNVLTGIIGNLSLILMTAPPDATTSERITGAKRSAIRAQELNRKLLALAKGEDSGLDAPFEATPAKPTIVPIPSMMKTEPAPAKAESVKSQRLDAPPTRSATEAKPRVLVLDDEEAICALIAAALGSMGYDVVEANDADQAIKACEEAAKSGQRFELVISDLSLPGELSGEEAVRRMKQIDPELKAIVSSGYDSDPVMSKFRDHGFCAAISKPYDISKLGRVVTNALKAEEEQRKTA